MGVKENSQLPDMAGFEELLHAEREPKAATKAMRAIFFMFDHCSEFPAA